MRITIVLALAAWIFLSSCSPVYAQYDDIGQSIIHPAHPLYFLKSIRENLEMHFAKTPKAKMVRQLEFATRRIREVKALVSMKNHDLVEPTLERYWFHMNTVLGYRPREEWLILSLNYTIATHMNELEVLYQKVGRREKMTIRAAIFRVLDSSDIPAEERAKRCQFLVKEASSSALSEVEAAILRERADKCIEPLLPR